MIIQSSYEAAWWLKNNHLQTLYPIFLNSSITDKVIEHEYLELNDGDFIELIWSNHNLPTNAPLVIVLHGLGGNINSHYIGKTFNSLNQNGMRCVLMHFRGAGEKPNRMLKCYHAGETTDLDTIIKYIHYKEPHSIKMAVGVSLGGAVLLKWLCENGTQPWIKKAFTISVPFELDVCAKCISQGFSNFYQYNMLRSLKRQIIKKIELFSLKYPFTVEDLMSFNDFFTFDNHVTAPLFGFKNAEHYYQVGSCRQYLSGIHTPTLILHALDDPFMDTSVVPHANQLSKEVTLEISANGGHVGFIEHTEQEKISWWPAQRMIKYLSEY